MAAPSRPAARRRLGAEERRRQIIRATTEIIARDGYTAATLTDVADAAGVAKGLLWHYFEDREDLMRRTLAQLAAELRAAMVADVDVTAPVPEVIRGVFRRAARFTRTHAAELATIDQIAHNLRTPDGTQAISMADYEVVHADHRRLLARGQREGAIREGDLQVMAVAYQGSIDAMLGHLQAHPDVEPAEHAALAAEYFLSGAATPHC